MEHLMGLTIGQIVGWCAGIIAGLSLLIEFNKKINFRPISAMLNWIGAKINKAMLDKISDVDDRVEAVKGDLDALVSDYEVLKEDIKERDAVTYRVRILRFAEEVRNGVLHSKESFDQALDDIDRYEQYCNDHPNFVNNKTVRSKKLIIAAYDKCMEQNDFTK